VIYQAKNKRTNKRVICKRCHSEKSFERESEMLRELEGRGALEMQDVDDTHMMIAMEVGVETMREYIDKNKGLTLPMKHAMALSILQAVAALHEKGICHMDIKPQNIMCFDMASQEWKLIDMEKARKTGEDIPGRISWKTASPEHNKYMETGKGKSEASSDIFSLGMTMMYMYTGHYLYEEEEEAKEKMGHMREEEVTQEAIHKFMVRYGVDCEPVDNMITHMVEVEPKKRWTAEALIAHRVFTGREATRAQVKARMRQEQISEEVIREVEERTKVFNEEQMKRLMEMMKEANMRAEVIMEMIEKIGSERKKEGDEEKNRTIDAVEQMTSHLSAKSIGKTCVAFTSLAMNPSTTSSMLKKMEERMKELLKRGEKEISKMSKEDIMAYLKH